MSFFFALAALFLLIFAAFFAGLVERSAGEMGALPAMVLSGGAMAAAFLILSALGMWVLSREATATESEPGPVAEALRVRPDRIEAETESTCSR